MISAGLLLAALGLDPIGVPSPQRGPAREGAAQEETAQEGAARSGPAPAGSAHEAPASEAWLELRIDPLADLMFEAAFATQPPSPFSAPPPARPEGMPGLDAMGGGDEALAAARRLHSVLSHPLAWGVLASALEGCGDCFDWQAKLEALPEPVEAMGRSISLREPAVEFAQALAMLEDEFRSRCWPGRRERLLRAQDRLRTGLMPRASEIYADLNRQLGLELAPARVPVFLVWNHLAPGAATYLREGGGGICFVGVSAQEVLGPGGLQETVIHESLHGLDILTPAGRGALEGLRTRLRAAGLPPGDRRMRDVPHGLMFVAAGEAVRRHLDPQHRHYGDQVGLYRRLGASMQCTRGPWTAYLDGSCGREQALDRAIQILLEDQRPR